MSVRTAILPALDTVRSVLGPNVMDLRPTLVTIIQRVWAGGEIDSPADFYNDTSLVLPNFTAVRHQTEREIAGSGGRYEDDNVIVGPVTPQYTNLDGTTGGFTEAQLDPTLVFEPGTTGVQVIYRLTLQSGATGISGDYRLTQLHKDKSLRFLLYLARTLRTA